MKNLKNDTVIFLQKLTSVYIVLLITVFLFYFDSHGYLAIAEAKLSAFHIICGGYIILAFLILLEGLLIGQLTPDFFRTLLRQSSWTQRLILLYLLLTLLSALFSPYGKAAWTGVSRHEGALTIAVYCLCFLFVSNFGKAERWMLHAFAVSVFVFCCLCMVQLYGGNPFTLYPEGYNYFDANQAYSGAYLGTIGNVDLVAAFLSIAIPVLWVAILRLQGKLRFLLLVPLAAAIFVLLKMFVLAGIVAVFAGALLSLPVVLPASERTRKRIAIAIAGCILAGIAVLLFCDFGTGTLHEVHELMHGRGSDSFGTGRMYIWKNVLERIPDNLWFGTGPDTMAYAGIEPFTRYDEALDTMIVAYIDTAHNEYLNILYHQGVFALAAYLAALFSAAWRWVKQSRENAGAAVFGAATLCYCIQAFFGISMCITAPFFWLTLALLDGCCGYKKI